MNYIIHILIMINIYIILAGSANLLIGMTNLLSICQAAFYGIGAYLTVLCLNVLHLPLIPTLIFIMLFTGLTSLLISVPAIRLKGDYFVLATLGFQLIVYTILYNWIPVTRGPYGISGIPAPRIFGIIEISGVVPYLILSLVLTILSLLFFTSLIRSPFGRNLKGVRDNDVSMLALGRDVTKIKVQIFFISSSFIALAGFLYATYMSYIDPNSFNLDESIFILSALIIGGTGNIKGSIIGAVFVILLPELLRFIGLPDSVAANLRQIIYGLAIIIFMRLRPTGIAGEYELK